MVLEFREFEKANPGIRKPSALPFLSDVNPDTNFDLLSIAAFDNQFFDNLDPETQSEFKKDPRFNALQKKDKVSAEAKRQHLVQEAKVADGVLGALRGFLPKDYLLEVAQFDSVHAYGKVSDVELQKKADTDRFKRALQSPNLADKEGKPTDFATKLYGDKFIDFVFNKRYQGNILPTNLNLFEGDSGQLFSSSDDVGKEIFGSYENFKQMQDTSLSPRSILDKRYKGFSKDASAVLEKLGQTKVQGAEFKALEGEFVNSEDRDLIIAGQKNPLTNKEVVIKPNFYDMVMADFVPRFSDKDVYSFVSMGYENMTRFANVAREPYGNFKDFPQLAEGETIPDPKNPNLSPREKEILATKDKLIGRTKEWWDAKVKGGISESIYTVYSAMGAFSQIALNAMDWGNWDAGNQNSKVAEFQSKIVNGYLGNLETEYLPKFRASNVLTPEDFRIDSTEQGDAIFQALVDENILDRAGRLTDNFDPANPKLNLGDRVDTQGRAYVLNKLKQAAVGPYSFVVADKTKINGEFRQDARVKAYDGNYYSLNEIMSSIGKGETPQEKMKNVKLAYDYILNIHNSMTGLSLDSTQNRGELVYTKGAGNSVIVNVGKEAKWQEYTTETKKAKDGTVSIENSWKDKTGDLSLTFESKEEAEAFKEDTREMLAHLEGIVSTMGREVDGQPIYVLTDNSASINSDTTITPDDPNYRMVLDRLPDSTLMKSPLFTAVQDKFSAMTVDSYFSVAFNKSISNSMQTAQWKKDKEEYKKKKEDYERDELNRVREARRTESERKKQDMAIQMAQKKFADERRAKDAKSTNQAKARNEQSRSAKQKKQSK